jgi:hypothetical protein
MTTTGPITAIDYTRAPDEPAIGAAGAQFRECSVVISAASLEPKTLQDAYGVMVLTMVSFVGLTHRKFWDISWLTIYWVALIIFKNCIRLRLGQTGFRQSAIAVCLYRCNPCTLTLP